MANKYFVWKDANCKVVNPEWVEMDGRTFYAFTLDPANKDRRFVRLGNEVCEEADVIYIEATYEQYLKWHREEFKSYKNRKDEKEIPYRKISFDDMLLMTTTEGDTEKYEKAISKIYDEIRVLREELDTARKQLDINVDLSAEIKRLTEIFERDDLNFKEFDDCVIRRITECIRVMGDKSIIITLKGGFELREKI